jgi:hypothetical protein
MPPAAASKSPAFLRPLRRVGLGVAAALVLASLVAPAASAASCSKTYSYAGLVSAKTSDGIRTQLRAETVPNVTFGTVAGWVGVGGTDAWIQIGYNGFADGEHRLYYEVKQRGKLPRYTSVKEIETGEIHRVAVRERRDRPNWWHVVVDGRPVSPLIYLPGSHRRWQPMATAESWNGGRGNCNGLTYRFSELMLLQRGGGGWRKFPVAYDMQDPGYRLRRTSNGFVAATRATAL